MISHNVFVLIKVALPEGRCVHGLAISTAAFVVCPLFEILMENYLYSAAPRWIIRKTGTVDMFGAVIRCCPLPERAEA